MRYVIICAWLFAAALCGADCLAAGATRDSLRIQPSALDEYGITYGTPNPYSRTWKAFVGRDEIGEGEMFRLCGNLDLATRADRYENMKSQGVLAGAIISIGGDIMMIASARRSGNSANGLLIGGAMLSGAGLLIFTHNVLKPSKFAPYEAAHRAADSYNVSYRKP